MNMMCRNRQGHLLSWVLTLLLLSVILNLSLLYSVKSTQKDKDEISFLRVQKEATEESTILEGAKDEDTTFQELVDEEERIRFEEMRKMIVKKERSKEERINSSHSIDGNTAINATKGYKFPFRYLIQENNACDEGVRIINLIPIEPANKDRRNLIRNLWANPKYYETTRMKTLFVLGVDDSTKSIKIDVESESRQFHDIIQLDFIDSYLNLTWKTFSMLHWTKEHCPSAKWILKSDDDVFVNPFSLTRYLSSQRVRRRDFVCRMNENLKVCRLGDDCSPKWAVSKEEIPYDYYPWYCNGPAYVMSATIARRLYQMACWRKPHVMEDAYYTGILAKPLRPRYRDLSSLRFPSSYRRNGNGQYWRRYALMCLNLEKYNISFTSLWRKILEDRYIT